MGSELGSGQFGKVYEGKWCSSDEGEVPVAIKTLKQEACGSDRIKFLQEGAIMAQFKDPNIVTFHGVVIDEEPVSGTYIFVYWYNYHSMERSP